VHHAFLFGRGIFEFFSNHCGLLHQNQQRPLLKLFCKSESPNYLAIIAHCSPDLSSCSSPENPVGTSLWHESSSSLWFAAFFPNYHRDGKNCMPNHSCNLLQSKRNSTVYTGVHGAHANLPSEIVCSSVVPRTAIEQGEQSVAVVMMLVVWSQPYQHQLR